VRYEFQSLITGSCLIMRAVAMASWVAASLGAAIHPYQAHADGTPTTFRLGGLFPLYKTAAAGFARDSGGIQRLAAFLLAVDEINNSSDILPRTKITVALQDSKRHASTTFTGMFELISSSFGGLGADAVVGAASSGPSSQAALVAKQYKVPQLSYASTSSKLSNSIDYPFFGRVVPSDVFQAQALAHMVATLFKWTRVALVTGSSIYGTEGGKEFKFWCRQLGVTVAPQILLHNDDLLSSLEKEMAALKKSGVKVVVLFTQETDGAHFLYHAHRAAYLTAGVTVIVSDAMSGALEKQSNLQWALPLPDGAFRGVFGLSSSRGDGTTRYQAFQARFKSQPSTAGQANGTCTPGTDADGAQLYERDHDRSALTPALCTGVEFGALATLDSYAAYAYDATLALAHAAHVLIEENPSDWWDPQNSSLPGRHQMHRGQLLWNTIISKSFEVPGTTGNIRFNNGTFKDGVLWKQGDTASAQYVLWNHDGISHSAIGSWNEQDGFDVTVDGSMSFSTVDNHKPPDWKQRLPPTKHYRADFPPIVVAVVVVALILLLVVVITVSHHKHATLTKHMKEVMEKQLELHDTIDALDNLNRNEGQKVQEHSNPKTKAKLSTSNKQATEQVSEFAVVIPWVVTTYPESTTRSPCEEPSTMLGTMLPNETLVRAMSEKSADFSRIQLMASKIRLPSYSLIEFLADCQHSFPELNLYVTCSISSSGRTSHDEYQRTIGALFAVYWLLRLESDGKRGFSLGVHLDSWVPKTSTDVDGTMPSNDTSFFKMSTIEKKLAFLSELDCAENSGFRWTMFQGLMDSAGCSSPERVMALLCLTAIHGTCKSFFSPT
jgi:ABC-type branched-subunit amino acid transport system substrate-binding protein